MYIDEHHSAEDVAITMGKAISDALGDKGGCTRMGLAWVFLWAPLRSVSA